MSTYEISKSSLLSLKAEILRKQQELTKAKAENETKIRNLRKNTPLELKNKNVDERRQNDISEEDENLLKKSRSVLEAKALLYERLSKDPSKLTEDEKEYNRRCLVRFERKSKYGNLPPGDEDDVDRYPPSEDEKEAEKIYEPPKDPNEEWVEYIDCLGRTRTCMRKDLEHLKSKDKDLRVVVDARKRNNENPEARTEDEKPTSPKLTEENELLSSDMRRELLRQQWEKEEEELRDKSNIHYQDILFNEARTHGVGYYAFSKDEEERAKQQEALKKLREDTKQQQAKAQDAKARREKQLAARVKAAKNRRRARLGLPPEEDEPEAETNSAKEEEKIVEENLEEERKKSEEGRKKHIRPWDIGKKGLKEHYEYSQEEWVDKQRKERPEEFAPPKQYNFRGERKRYEVEEIETKKLVFSTKKREKPTPPMEPIPIINECSDSEDIEEPKRGRNVTIPPPPTYEYYGPSSTKTRKRAFDEESVDESIEAGLKFLRQQIEKKQGSHRHDDDIFLS